MGNQVTTLCCQDAGGSQGADVVVTGLPTDFKSPNDLPAPQEPAGLTQEKQAVADKCYKARFEVKNQLAMASPDIPAIETAIAGLWDARGEAVGLSMDISTEEKELYDAEEQLKVLKAKASGAAAGKVDVEMHDGQKIRVISFTQRPLGMKFTNNKALGETKENPVYVSEVTEGGHAASLGVQTKWPIVKIAGSETSSMKFEQTKALFKQVTDVLPEKK